MIASYDTHSQRVFDLLSLFCTACKLVLGRILWQTSDVTGQRPTYGPSTAARPILSPGMSPRTHSQEEPQ
jgi:hypothetical protein